MAAAATATATASDPATANLKLNGDKLPAAATEEATPFVHPTDMLPNQRWPTTQDLSGGGMPRRFQGTIFDLVVRGDIPKRFEAPSTASCPTPPCHPPITTRATGTCPSTETAPSPLFASTTVTSIIASDTSRRTA
ncbi:hypothetical protein L7F22_007822 [Adiantum nelumboides]|nr:hypothetical protein [Adiantum nelumboides]